MDIYNGEVFIDFITAGKCETEEDFKHLAEVNEVPPKFGRNWWYSYPRFKFTNIGWKLSFMCFALTYDNYININKG